VKERPILMSAPMVRPTLADTKLQTRRAVKHPLLCNLSFIVDCGDGWWGDEDGEVQARCPYGQPGDRLWVREAFDFLPAGGTDEPNACEIVYWATGSHEKRSAPSTYNPMIYGHEKIRPSIHMPRWASRITLEVTGVRVERLQDISESDAIAEGMERLPAPVIDGGWSGPNRFTLKGMGKGSCAGLVSWNAPTAAELYQHLWEEINGLDSWYENPWVWVVEFKRVTT
jgi:hypothetical protein